MSAGASGIGHGKVILLGEHSVVYGRPALAVAIPRGAQASARPAQVDALAVQPWGVRLEATQPQDDPDREQLRRAFSAVLEHYPQPRPSLSIEASLQIPGGAGLGSSAALSVAVIAALDAALSCTHTLDEIIELSLAWERVFHGNPSGIDSAMAARGGLMLYRKGQALSPVHSARPLTLVVSHSGEHGSTKAMVESVARQHARDRGKAEQIFDAIEAVVNNGKSAIETGDHVRLGQLMDVNQKLLNTLMLSTTRLEEMCALSRSHGALGAKLTGGGGGGSMIALAADAQVGESIVAALRAQHYETFAVQVMS